jgi:UDP-glucose 4-epimerase
LKLFITGGSGFIGSHAVLALLDVATEIVVLDNLSNSSRESINRVEILAGRSINFIYGDVRDSSLLSNIFKDFKFDAVLHFAGLKSVGVSVSDPLIYYENNFNGTHALLNSMMNASVFNLVFSSSATIYGDSCEVPISEDARLGRPTNPYGRTKWMVEEMLRDLVLSDDRWNIAVLRYFNPIGAHESGLIGEDPRNIPSNLIPYIAQVGAGKLPNLKVFGSDYPTKDGTGVRDYIHVMDLVDGHIKALDALKYKRGFNVWNLGSGVGYSVLEIINAFELANGIRIPYEFSPRRPGDIAISYTDPSKAFHEIGWKAKRGILTMMRDSWNWQSNNPNGYLT